MAKKYTGTKILQRQIDLALQGRDAKGQSKWYAYIAVNRLYLFHYHHLLLVYDKVEGDVYTWHQTNTDKRGLDFGIKYLDKWYRDKPIQTINSIF